MSRDYIAYSSFQKMVSLVENIQTLSDHILTQLFFFSLIYIKCFVMILTRTIIIIIIIRQPLCPVVGRRPQHVVSKWPCLVLSSAISCRSSICPGRLSTAWLVSLDVFSCHMVSKWWRARSIGRLWGGWYALPRTISFFSQCRLYLWVLSSP